MVSQSIKETDGHESRIQRLEVVTAELSVKTAEIAVELNGLSERVVSGFDNLSQKLDETVSHISEHVQQQQEVVKEILPTVKIFTELQARKGKRVNFLRKCTWIIITGLLTLVTEKLCTTWFFGG